VTVEEFNIFLHRFGPLERSVGEIIMLLTTQKLLSLEYFAAGLY